MDYAGEAARLKDPLRCSVASPLLSDTASWSALEDLAAQGVIAILSVKNRFRDGAATGGYRDMNVNVRFRGSCASSAPRRAVSRAQGRRASLVTELCRSLDLVGELEPSSAGRWMMRLRRHAGCGACSQPSAVRDIYCFSMASLIGYFYGYGMTHGKWNGRMEDPDLSMGRIWAVWLSMPYALVGILLVRAIADRIRLKTLATISTSLIGRIRIGIPLKHKSRCKDADLGATDIGGDSCTYYSGESECGRWDDVDFSANDMCCDCGGGSHSVCSKPGPQRPHQCFYSQRQFRH